MKGECSMPENKFTWIPFYEELATKLLDYKNNRQELLAKMKAVFAEAGYNFPKMEKDGNAVDLDPFTFFAHFNKGNNRQRLPLLTGIAKEFSIKANVPADFDGIPTADPRKANFYIFKEDGRGEHDIDTLWDLFEATLKLAENNSDENRQNFCKYYNSVIEMRGIAWNITMALYWVRPYNYLNLDGRNRWFLNNVENMPVDFVSALNGLDNEVPSASTYLQIVEKCKTALQNNNYPYKSIPELSFYAWKTSEEVNQRKKEIDNQSASDTNYWIFSPGEQAEKWDTFLKKGIMALGWGKLGDLNHFENKKQIQEKMTELYGTDSSHKNDVHAVWEFANEMKPGDIVFVKKGLTKIIGRGEVLSEYQFVEGASDGFGHERKVRWTHSSEKESHRAWAKKTLTNITDFKEDIRKLDALFDENSIEEDKGNHTQFREYTEKEFLNDVFMDEDSYTKLVNCLENKKNIILQGAPGVGKTFAAKRLAYSMIGEADPTKVMVTQFHQSYTYEDFIMGFRPNENGFEIKKGIFYTFCKKAEEDSENYYFFIIDEINRGNLSKILGELFMLLEADKRGQKLQLMYKDEEFGIPKNVYIIGTMNTADRSLAMVDYALRRRFVFFDMTPGFDNAGFIKQQQALHSEKFDRLIECVKGLNKVISDDESLGSGFCVGHSYFCDCFDPTKSVDIQSIVEYELIPLLKEYWFDNPEKVKFWSEELRRAVK